MKTKMQTAEMQTARGREIAAILLKSRGTGDQSGETPAAPPGSGTHLY